MDEEKPEENNSPKPKDNFEKPEEASEKRESLTDKLRGNPFILSTAICGVLAVLLLVVVVSGSSGGITGKIVSGNEAGNNLIEFLNGVTNSEVALVSTEDFGDLYKVTIEFKGKKMPIYVTKDGSYYTTNLLPLVAPAQDKEGKSPQNIPKSDKPKVELFIMSMCPYGTQAEKGILPVLKSLGDKIDFTLRFVSYSMHGKDEIDENTRLYCVQKEEPEKLYDYMKCYLQAKDPIKWSGCISEVGIEKTKINNCIESADTEFNIMGLFNDKSTWSGGKYPQYNLDKNLNVQYGVQGSPTLVINGKIISSARSPAAYLDIICQAFNNAPSECGKALSTDALSPGFGYSASSSSTNSASCS